MKYELKIGDDFANILLPYISLIFKKKLLLIILLIYENN
jgi:hypothetical protein